MAYVCRVFLVVVNIFFLLLLALFPVVVSFFFYFITPRDMRSTHHAHGQRV